MTILEISLLVIGLCLCIGSFFVSEKLSNSDKENLQKLTKEQIEEIIKDKMADARVDMENILSESIDDSMETLDRKTDAETNKKIMEISQYSDAVLESVDKSHKEITFMYSMLNEKQASVVELTNKLTEAEEKLLALDASIAKKLDFLKDREEEIKNEEARLASAMEELNIMKEAKEVPEPVPFNEALAEKFADEAEPTPTNNNMEILNLHDMGLTEVDIAKKLGRGLGEVKFVLGLYQEGRR